MTPADLTTDLLISWGGADVFNQAVRLSRTQTITSSWDPVEHVISGTIDEGRGWDRPVRFELLDDGTIRSHCACELNRNLGQVCRHVVAVGLHAMCSFAKDMEPADTFRFPAAALATREAPVEVALAAEYFEDEGQFLVFPQADLPVEHVLSDDRYVVHGKRGYVFAAGRWFPIRRVVTGPFQVVYTQDQEVTRAAMPSFIRNNLPVLRRQVEVRMSPSEDMFTFRPATPVFEATLHGTTARSLALVVKACYGDPRSDSAVRVPLDGPAATDTVCLPDADDMLLYHVRNPAAEKAAVALLKRLDFELSATQDPVKNKGGTRYFLEGDERDAWNFLGSGLATLRRANWRVDVSERVAEWLNPMPSIVPTVTVKDLPGPGGDFDVSYSFDVTGDGGASPVHVPHALVQQAINCGNSFIRQNGRVYLLDAPAVTAMRDVFSDCAPTGSSGGHFRVKGIYAPYVRASLEALDAAEFEDEGARNWRESAAARNRDRSARFEPVDLGTLETTLRPYQKEGVYWMRFLEKSGLSGLLADEMGLGKTLQTLTWISLERTNPEARGKPALVVCPTSLVRNWEAEAEKFVPHLKRLVVSGPDRARLFAKIPEADLVITSYALLQRDLEDAWLGKTFSVMVLDEAQHIKNRRTRNAHAAKAVESIQKLVLTGTPVENSVADVWSIFDFLLPDYLGGYESFKCAVEDPIALGGADGAAAQQKLHHKLHPFILRRLKRDVAKDLPEKIVKVAYCPLTPDQQRLTNEIRRKAKAAKTKFEMLAVLMRLRQVANHTALLEKDPAAGESGKLDVFFELLDEAMDAGHRVLVFSQFVHMLAILRGELEKRQIRYCYLDGATKDRLGECRRFNADASIPVFLISLHAGGTGLNLTGADMVIHFDPWWNPAVEAQATDRAHRIGQKKTVYVVKMISEMSVEERVLALQQKKQLVIDATVDASDSAIVGKMTFDDLKAIAGI